MSGESIAAIVSSTTALLAALVWPALVLFLVLKFGTRLVAALGPIGKAVAERISEGDGGEAGFTVAGMTFKARLDVASTLLANATAEPGVAGGTVSTGEARRLLEESIPNDTVAARIAGKRLLWVDDRPVNNELVIDALDQLGVGTVRVLSTRQAMDLLYLNTFDAIISDMGRDESDGFHDRAGYELLSAVRDNRIDSPFFIYAGSNIPEHRAMALERGAQGSTNRPTELIKMVTSALASR